MKTWNYPRALRWLAIEPETRTLRNVGPVYATWNFVDIQRWGTRNEFYPPKDPVPLAEVLYELVSGEEEEFEIRGDDTYTKISWDDEMQRFEVYQEDVACWNHISYFSTLEKVATFHRIAEPEEKKREPKERQRN